jgi:hypothetical protein
VTEGDHEPVTIGSADRFLDIVNQLHALGAFVPFPGSSAVDDVIGVEWDIGVAGVEITQATQYFNYQGQGSGITVDNFVPTVAEKTLVLRVYPTSVTPWPQGVGTIYGTVAYAVHTDIGGVGWTPFPVIGPINGPLPPRPPSIMRRGNAEHTLNFRIPAAHCRGLLRFTVTLYAVFSTASGSSFYTSAPTTFTRFFYDIPKPKIHGVLIHYTGSGLDLPAPKGTDLVDTLAWVQQVYPVSSFNYTGCDVVEFDGDLTLPGGTGCGPGWGQLMQMIWNMRSMSGTDDVFVGLLPQGVPTSSVRGCGGGGVAVAYRGESRAMAQEIAHAFDRRHAPCGFPGNVDPTYPHYPGVPSGSIGEFGYDTLSSTVLDPAETYDYMSYCPSAWTSPHTYIGLWESIVSNEAAASANTAEIHRAEREHLYVHTRVHRGGTVELLSSYRLRGRAPRETGESLEIWCDLRDGNGHVLFTHECYSSDPHQHREAGVLDLYQVVPWDERVREIVFYRHGQALGQLSVDQNLPEVQVTAVRSVEERSTLRRIEWSAAGERGELRYLVRYSHDGGVTWRVIAADLTKTSHVLDLNLLPGGDRCRFQVVASAGMQTASAMSEDFEVSRKARIAHIIAPADDETVATGQPVHLLGGGFSPDFGTSAFLESVWSSDLDGELGVGHQVLVERLSVGRHQIALTVPDGLNGSTSTSVGLDVRESGEAGPAQ